MKSEKHWIYGSKPPSCAALWLFLINIQLVILNRALCFFLEHNMVWFMANTYCFCWSFHCKNVHNCFDFIHFLVLIDKHTLTMPFAYWLKFYLVLYIFSLLKSKYYLLYDFWVLWDTVFIQESQLSVTNIKGEWGSSVLLYRYKQLWLLPWF